MGRAQLLAHLLSEVLAPAPVAGTLLMLVAWHSAPTLADALRWSALAVLFAVVVPGAYIIYGTRRRRLSDRHVRQRHQRPLPLLVGITSVLLGGTVLVQARAPRELVALVAAMNVGLGSTLLVTLAWKISIHVAVISGAAVTVVVVFGLPGLLAAPLVAGVACARVAVGDHTPGQAIAGALLGATVAATIFPVLR